MICSRARSLCTFTALVEIRCCGPSSCDEERERGERKRGEEKRADSVRLQQTCSGLLAPGDYTDWQAQPTAWETDGGEEGGGWVGEKVCQSKPEISGLKVGWEICVLTIWNRHRHADGTNPGRNYFKLSKTLPGKKNILNKRDLFTKFSYIAIQLIDHWKRNYKIYTSVYLEKCYFMILMSPMFVYIWKQISFFFFSLKASNYCPILSPMPACCLKLLPCC